MGEVFTRLCPEYLHYGMTWDQYWHGNPWMVVSFARAHDLTIQQRNQEMWLQGLYVHDAFSVVLSNAFAQKGSTPKRYMSEPLNILPKTDEERAADEERELRKMVASLNRWEKAFNAQKKETESD